MAVTQGAPVNNDWVEDASLPTLKDRFYKEELFGEEPENGYEKWVQDASGSTIEREYYKRGVLGTLTGGIDCRVSSLIDLESSRTRESLDSYVDNKPFNKILEDVDNRRLDQSVSFKFNKYGTISYSVATIHQGSIKDPNILKPYWDISQESPFIARETDIEQAMTEVGATFLANGSGLVHISGIGHGNKNNVTVRGMVIIDGKPIQDFEGTVSGSWTGTEALAMMKDGTLKGYSYHRGDTVHKAVSDGAIWASSFGPILVENGFARDLSDPMWKTANGIVSSLNFYGQLPNGDIVVVNGPGVSSSYGGTLADQTAIALSLGCDFAISMDRGGSAQAFSGQSPILLSGDRDTSVPLDFNKRLVANYLYTKAPIVNTIQPDPALVYNYPLLFKPQTVGTTDPRFTKNSSGEVSLFGTMVLTPAEEGGQLTAWPTTTASTMLKLPPIAWPKKSKTGILTGPGITRARWTMNTDGNFRVSFAETGFNYAVLDGVKWDTGRSS